MYAPSAPPPEGLQGIKAILRMKLEQIGNPPHRFQWSPRADVIATMNTGTKAESLIQFDWPLLPAEDRTSQLPKPLTGSQELSEVHHVAQSVKRSNRPLQSASRQ
jgi:hypothetical protein